MESILIVIPTYGAFEYAAMAVKTAFAHTRTVTPHVVVVDDASPDRLSQSDAYEAYSAVLCELQSAYGRDRLQVVDYDENGGLTRSWNRGLAMLKSHTYGCVTNSDVLFSPDWDRHICAALRRETVSLVGPVTNAPGTNAEQYVGNYSVTYRRGTGDSLDAVRRVQCELETQQGDRVKLSTLNGFCMVAKTVTWWKHAYDDGHVFRPRNETNSRGDKNPTPLMTLNEYELQARWHAAGLKTGIALGSYVFHYRAVSRGDAHRKGDWARRPLTSQ